MTLPVEVVQTTGTPSASSWRLSETWSNHVHLQTPRSESCTRVGAWLLGSNGVQQPGLVDKSASRLLGLLLACKTWLLAGLSPLKHETEQRQTCLKKKAKVNAS